MNGDAGIVVGCEQLGGTDWGQVDRAEAERAMVEAYELGLRAFDTADVYGLGESERRLSSALGGRRHEAFIGTKGGVRWQESAGRAKTFFDNSPEYLAYAIDRSLARLRIERIGLYFVHWPDGKTPVQAVIDCLENAKEAGKIGAYGFSNFPATVAIQSRSRGLDAVQVSFNLLSDASQRRELAALGRAGLTRYGYGALAQGLLTGKYSRDTRFDRSDRRHRLPHFQKDTWPQVAAVLDVLEEVSAQTGISQAGAATQVLRQSRLIDRVIVGIRSAAQARDLAAVRELRMDDALVTRLLRAWPGARDADG